MFVAAAIGGIASRNDAGLRRCTTVTYVAPPGAGRLWLRQPDGGECFADGCRWFDYADVRPRRFHFLSGSRCAPHWQRNFGFIDRGRDGYPDARRSRPAGAPTRRLDGPMTIKSASIRTAQVTALFGIAFAVSVPSVEFGGRAPAHRESKAQFARQTVIAMVH